MSNEALNYFDEINFCKYLYLKEISEPEDNSLRVVIEEAIAGDKSGVVSDAGLSGNEIIVTDESRVFEIYFDSYIGYSVVDESLALPDDSEVFDGRIFCVYEKSNYLDYLKKASFASEDHPGPFVHYGFNCLNHIIDIASTDEPEIKKLK